MTQIHSISILAPLAVGVVAQACTIIIYLVPVRATVNLIRREKSLGHVGMPWTDLGIFGRAVFYASLPPNKKLRIWAHNFGLARHPTTIPDWILPNLRQSLHDFCRAPCSSIMC